MRKPTAKEKKERKSRRLLAIQEFEQQLEALTCPTIVFGNKVQDIEAESGDVQLPFINLIACRNIKTNIKIDVTKESFLQAAKKMQKRKTLVFKRKMPTMAIYALAYNGVVINTRLPA